MAAPTLSTSVSRRSMLAGGTLAAIALPAVTLPAAVSLPAVAEGDLRVALLAEDFRHATDTACDWTDMIERRYGPFAYYEPEYKRRHDMLWGRQQSSAEALAQARPSSIQGLVAKLRPACYCDDLRHMTILESDETILHAALHDLEYIAENMA